MKTASDIVSELDKRGWLLLDFPAASSLVDFAANFGKPVPSRNGGSLSEILTPKDSVEAKPNSLSRFYGFGAFPFHTDSATHEKAPRLIFLRLVDNSSSDRPTVIVDPLLLSSEAQRRKLQNDVWVINGGTTAFYSTLLTRAPDGMCLRYDPHCMRPAHARFVESQAVIESLISKAEVHTVDWVANQLLVLDNWRVLHGRGCTASGEDRNRLLERVMTL
jgi:alpha-ketoglutarate-dependent taurine dioxygenase